MKEKTKLKGKVIGVNANSKTQLTKDIYVIYKNSVCKLEEWDSKNLKVHYFNQVVPAKANEITLLFVDTGKKCYPLNIYNNQYNVHQFALDAGLIDSKEIVEFEIENICVYRSDGFGSSAYDRYVDFANITSLHNIK